MKTKKSYRLLSALLAILMVLAVCPVFAVEAEPSATPTAQAATPTYWDGTVPGLDLTTTTIPEFIMSGQTYTITQDDYAAHITDTWSNGAATLVAEDETGFAMLVLLTNCPFEITGRESEFHTPASSATGNNWAVFAGMEIRIGRDLYLNAPGNHVNQVAPLLWRCSNDTGWQGLTINGTGKSVNGWYMDVTLASNEFVNCGFVGALSNESFTAKDLALIDMEMKVATTEGFTNTVVIGGIVGGGINRADGTVTVQNCYVDLSVDFVTHNDVWDAAPGDWIHNMNLKADISGLVGELSYVPGNIGDGQNSKINKVNISNNTVLFDFNTNTDICRVSAITGSIRNDATSVTIDNIVIAKLKNSGSKTPQAGNGSVYHYAPAALPATFVVTDIWTLGTTAKTGYPDYLVTEPFNANFTDASNKVVTLENIVDDEFWATNGTGMADAMTKLYVPVPTTLATNPVLIAQMDTLQSTAKTDMIVSALNAGSVINVGTADDLILVATLANANSKAAKIALTANIDMAGKTMPVINTLHTLEGNGYIIDNYTNTVICTTGVQMGGFTAKLTGSIQNVAFTNYNVEFTSATPTTACEYWVGGLYGANGATNTITVTNVYMEGSLKITGSTKGNTRIGTIAATHQNWDGNVGATFTNCVFIGETNKTTNLFGGYFGESAGSEWNGILSASADGNGKYTIQRENRQVKINNCYAIPYVNNAGTVSLTTHIGNNVGLHAVALRNVYQPGNAAQHLNHAGAVGYENVVDALGNSLWYLDCFNVGDIANGKEMAPAANGSYGLNDFKGTAEFNAMQFSDNTEWVWFENGTPIPAVFAATGNAVKLTVTSIAGMSQPIQVHGAQLRLDKDGLRFVAEFDVENHQIAAGENTVEYGVMILPTVAITSYGETLTYDNANVLKICTTDTSHLLADGDARLGGMTAKLAGGKFLLAVLTNIPEEVLKSGYSFTVLPYVAYKDAQGAVVKIFTGENDASYSGVGVANELCASDVSDEIKKTVCQNFQGAVGFKYVWNNATDEMITHLEINADDVIIGANAVASSDANYNAYYMEANTVLSFKEELALQTGLTLPIVQEQDADGQAGIHAYVDTTMAANAYSIAISNNTVVVKAGHYAALSEALDVLLAKLVASSCVLERDYEVNANSEIVVSGIGSFFNNSNLLSTYGGNAADYTLVWNDEFNSTNLDLDRWTYSSENPIKTDDKVNHGVDRDTDATVSGGTVTMNSSYDASVGGNVQTTYLLTTFDTMNYNGGYLEIRADMPYEVVGKFAALWTQSGRAALFIREWKTENGVTDYNTTPYGDLGNGMGLEVDMVEMMSGHMQNHQGAIHLYPSEWSAAGDREQNECSWDFGSTAAAGGFHVYGFYWNTEWMLLTVDGELHYAFSLKKSSSSTTTAPNNEHYTDGDFNPGKIALALVFQNDVFTPEYAEQTAWYNGTGIDKTQNYNADLTVDYVRLYQTEGNKLYLPKTVGNGKLEFDYVLSPYTAG